MIDLICYQDIYMVCFFLWGESLDIIVRCLENIVWMINNMIIRLCSLIYINRYIDYSLFFEKIKKIWLYLRYIYGVCGFFRLLRSNWCIRLFLTASKNGYYGYQYEYESFHFPFFLVLLQKCQ